MKSFSCILATTLLLCIAGIPSAIAGTKTVTITNNTSYTLTQLFASPSSSTADWNTDPSQNLVAAQSIAAGQQGTVTINDGLHHCHYDLMAVLYGATQAAYTYTIDTCGGGGTWAISGM
jgi:hypothetical protein